MNSANNNQNTNSSPNHRWREEPAASIITESRIIHSTGPQRVGPDFWSRQWAYTLEKEDDCVWRLPERNTALEEDSVWSLRTNHPVNHYTGLCEVNMQNNEEKPPGIDDFHFDLGNPCNGKVDNREGIEPSVDLVCHGVDEASEFSITPSGSVDGQEAAQGDGKQGQCERCPADAKSSPSTQLEKQSESEQGSLNMESSESGHGQEDASLSDSNYVISPGKRRRLNTTATDSDVLNGRGEVTKHHPGNKRFREERDRLKEKYLSESRNKRKRFSLELAKAVHDWGGAFLQKNEDGTWSEISDRDAIKKCQHALREKYKNSKPK